MQIMKKQFLNMKVNTSASLNLKNVKKWKREDINLMKKNKLKVDSDKSCPSSSDIHDEGDIEQKLEEDIEETAQITDVTLFNESEKNH